MKKVERLEIENKLLRESLERIRQDMERFDQIPVEKRYTTENMIGCIVSAKHYSNFEEYVERAIDLEERKRFYRKMYERTSC